MNAREHLEQLVGRALKIPTRDEPNTILRLEGEMQSWRR
jgi:hypothetical protein